MTQEANPRTVLGPFDGQTLQSGDRMVRLDRRGDRFYWTELSPNRPSEPAGKSHVPRQPSRGHPTQSSSPHTLPADRMAPPLDGRRDSFSSSAPVDPANEGNGERTREVVMLTGSRHQQVCWAEGENGSLEQFPWVYEIHEQRWVPSENTALRPEGVGQPTTIWNHSCLRCHSVAPEPRRDSATHEWDSHVAELGIACGACHGPSRDHVEANKNPLHRYLSRGDSGHGSTIVNPAKLGQKESVAVCGQCHSNALPKSPETYFATGPGFVPGDRMEQHFVGADPEVESRFQWPDGASRIAGREYGDTIQSACYLRGTMTCVSCHSMHSEDPVDQIAEDRRGDEGCLSCHTEYRDQLEAHTFHAAESTGSRCLNCHMPHSAYALLGTARTHKIESPVVSGKGTKDRPNACNLCHLDKTLAWTARHLNQRYGIPVPELDQIHEKVAASVLWGVRGDAVQRVVSAWHMGQPWAVEASGGDWTVPYLAEMLVDPYPAIRLVAHRSLRQLLGEDAVVPFDYIGDGPSRMSAARETIVQWVQQRDPEAAAPAPATLFRGPRSLNTQAIHELRRTRDNTPIFLAE